MIFRLSQKLAQKIKVGELAEMPLSANQFADWSGNLFNVGRTQYVILSNTKSLYSCLMLAKAVMPTSGLRYQHSWKGSIFERWQLAAYLDERCRLFVRSATKTSTMAKSSASATTGSSGDVMATSHQLTYPTVESSG